MVLFLMAASEEIPLIDLDGTVAIQLFFFLLLVFLLNRLLYRPYLRLVEARDRAIEGRVREAGELMRRAGTRLMELERRLAEAKAKGAEERTRIHAEAALREREIVEIARQEVAKKVAAAREEVANLHGDLRARLAAEADALGRQITLRVLGKERA